MPTSALTNGGGRRIVYLHQIPLDLRIAVAHDLATRWKLRGMDYAVFMLAAEKPEQDPALLVDVEKVELVMAGKRPRGDTPPECVLPPVLA